jgi:hypothetical protein
VPDDNLPIAVPGAIEVVLVAGHFNNNYLSRYCDYRLHSILERFLPGAEATVNAVRLFC